MNESLPYVMDNLNPTGARKFLFSGEKRVRLLLIDRTR